MATKLQAALTTSAQKLIMAGKSIINVKKLQANDAYFEQDRLHRSTRGNIDAALARDPVSFGTSTPHYTFGTNTRHKGETSRTDKAREYIRSACVYGIHSIPSHSMPCW